MFLEFRENEDSSWYTVRVIIRVDNEYTEWEVIYIGLVRRWVPNEKQFRECT